ncbi:MAG: hypothetical protein QXP31_03995 [Pyrobaculum sp.]
MFINLPAIEARKLVAGCAKVDQTNSRIVIDIITHQDIYLYYKDLIGVNELEKTPVRPLSYAVRTGWSVLQDYCTFLNRCDKDRDWCAYVSAGSGAMAVFLTKSSSIVEERGDLIVLFPLRGLQYRHPHKGGGQLIGRAWPLAILPRSDINIYLGNNYEVELKIDYESYSFVARTESAEHVKIYTRHVLNEVHSNQSGTLSIKSLLEKVWLGTTPALTRIDMYAQYPTVFLYDMFGTDLPRRVYSADGVRIVVSLSDRDVRNLASRLAQGGRGGLSALVKILANNIFAREFLSVACGVWLSSVFERETLVNSRYTDSIIFTSPILSRIIALYKELMFNTQCSSNAYSVLGRYANVVSSIVSRYNIKCDSNVLNKTVSSLNNFISGSAGVSDPLTLAFVTVAALLGGHGVAHLVSKALGFAEKDRAAENVKVYLSSSVVNTMRRTHQRSPLLNSLSAQPASCIKINGIFEVCSKPQDELLSVEVTVWDVSGSLSAVTRQSLQNALTKRLRLSGSDRCEFYENEETNRLNRVWNLISSSLQSSAPAQLDRFLSSRVQSNSCPLPPRELFRYMLPDALIAAGSAKTRDKAARLLRSVNKELQYVYPRHIKFCNDGCHICVLAPRGVCQLPPPQEPMWTSKTLALYLFEKASLLI